MMLAVPSVGDSKRALDEYESRIFMGGSSIISLWNKCEDSLLAAPIIIDLVVLTEVSADEGLNAVSAV